jgi:hypothetical protein
MESGGFEDLTGEANIAQPTAEVLARHHEPSGGLVIHMPQCLSDVSRVDGHDNSASGSDAPPGAKPVCPVVQQQRDAMSASNTDFVQPSSGVHGRLGRTPAPAAAVLKDGTQARGVVARLPAKDLRKHAPVRARKRSRVRTADGSRHGEQAEQCTATTPCWW